VIHTFTKDNQGWFISSIPEPHPFSRGALAMVAGADTFLDILAQGEDKVTLALSQEPIEGYNKLERTKLHQLGIGGADYILKEYMGQEINFEMWLCSVTMWVFKGVHPETIYFAKLAS
jgi:hypothetical protein